MERLESSCEFTVGVVLPAGGVGERMGLPTPKQYADICGRALLSYTVEAFQRIAWVKQIIVTVSKDRIDKVQRMFNGCKPSGVTVIEGGSTRHRSIYNGVKACYIDGKRPDVVIIHDAVRPFVDVQTTFNIVMAAKTYGAAGPVRPLVSTVVASNRDGFLDHALDRTKYVNSETPQAFQYNIIVNAYDNCNEHDLEVGTDCLYLAHVYAGCKAKLIEGSTSEWKVTYEKDLHAARQIIKESHNLVLLRGFDEQLSNNIKQALNEENKKLIVSEGTHSQGNKHDHIIHYWESVTQLCSSSTKDLCTSLDTTPRTCIHVVDNGTRSLGTSMEQLESIRKGVYNEAKKIDVCVVFLLLRTTDVEKMSAMILNILKNGSTGFSGQTFIV